MHDNPNQKVRCLRGTTVALMVLMLMVALSSARAQGPQSVADLAEGLTDAVVNISTTQTGTGPQAVPMPDLPPGSPFREFFEEFFDRQDDEQRRQRRTSSLGSGFVIDASGIIVTNNHVIAEADEIQVNFSDGRNVTAEVIGRDPDTDVALLRIETDRNLSAVKFGDSDAIRVGDWVMAIGNPFGLGGTVTLGIVSGRNRDIQAGRYDDFIQTDAAINRGNSGGPLFNMSGEVIAMNTAIFSPTGGSIGIGFAIPTSTMKPVIDQLLEHGEVRRGWLGVRIQRVTDDIAESLGLEQPRGALVAEATAGGPAAESGIEAGDIIVRFDGRDVPEMRVLPRIVANTDIGKTVEVVVLRAGEEVTLEVTLGSLSEGERIMARQDAPAGPDDPDEDVAIETVLGMRIAPMSPELRNRFGIADSVSGVVVTEVDQASSAAERNIVPGNVITRVGQQTVESPADVVSAVEAARAGGSNSVLLLISTPDGEVRFLAVRFED